MELCRVENILLSDHANIIICAFIDCLFGTAPGLSPYSLPVCIYILYSNPGADLRNGSHRVARRLVTPLVTIHS